jgi:hypothetical protein
MFEQRPERGQLQYLASLLHPERALTIGREALHRDAHRGDHHGFKLVASRQ